MNRNNEKKCIQCKSIIPIDANLCQHCSSFQKTWMNNLKYVSSIIGLLSASWALITYSIAHIPIVIATIWEKNELKILEFATNEELILANTGNRNLIITNIQLKIEKQKENRTQPTRIWSVNKEVKPKRILTHKAKEDDEKKKDVESFHEYDLVTYNAIDGKTPLTDVQWEWAFNQAKWPVQNPRCFTFVVYYSEDPTLLHYKNSVRQQKLSTSTDLKIFPTKAEIHFYSPSSHQTGTQNFQAEAILLRKPDKSCQQTW